MGFKKAIKYLKSRTNSNVLAPAIEVLEEAIKPQIDRGEYWQKKYEALWAERQWRDAKKDTPERGEIVLGMWTDGTIGLVYLTALCWYESDSDYSVENVSYWMPIPDAPGHDSREEETCGL